MLVVTQVNLNITFDKQHSRTTIALSPYKFKREGRKRENYTAHPKHKSLPSRFDASIDSSQCAVFCELLVSIALPHPWPIVATMSS